jgi:hypothetical protein
MSVASRGDREKVAILAMLRKTRRKKTELDETAQKVAMLRKTRQKCTAPAGFHATA